MSGNIEIHYLNMMLYCGCDKTTSPSGCEAFLPLFYLFYALNLSMIV
jgi:hypothetical protein